MYKYVCTYTTHIISECHRTCNYMSQHVVKDQEGRTVYTSGMCVSVLLQYCYMAVITSRNSPMCSTKVCPVDNMYAYSEPHPVM